MNDMDYPSTEEQLAILAVTNKKYPTPKKYPKPRDSYKHWRCSTWFHRPDALYFHLEEGQHYSDNMIQADYFGYKWVTKTDAYIKVDRESHDMTELTKDGFDIIRGNRMSERGMLLTDLLATGRALMGLRDPLPVQRHQFLGQLSDVGVAMHCDLVTLEPASPCVVLVCMLLPPFLELVFKPC